MEFKDYRAYGDGDDLKSVDWRAYLRLDRLVVKRFVEEADLAIYLFLDSSASMQLGTPSKFDHGRRIAAALAHVGFVNMDRVSLVSIADGVIADRSALRGKDQSWSAFRFLSQLTGGGRTSLETAFKRYFARPRPHGIVVVISDFLDPAGFEPGLAVLRNLGQEVLAVHLMAREELEPRLADDVELVDAEDGGALAARITPAVVDAYRQAFEAHAAAIEAYCGRRGWGYVRAVTDSPVEALVWQALRREGLLR